MTNATRQNIRGVAVLYRDYASHPQVKAMQQHSPNLLNFQVGSRGKQWFIVGFYLALNNAATIERVTTNIGQLPHRAALLVVGDFTTDPETPEGSSRREEITEAIAVAGLKGMSTNFLLCRKLWAQDRRTWCMHRIGREVRSHTD